MSEAQQRLIDRAQRALVDIHHGCTDDAAGVIHDLIREIRQLQDKIDESSSRS